MEVHPLIDSIADVAKNNELGFKVKVEPTLNNMVANIVLYRTTRPLVYIELKVQVKENGSFLVSASTMPRIEAPGKTNFQSLDKSFEDYINAKCKKFK